MPCGNNNVSGYVYTVQYGDTVTSIAEKYTGNADNWPQLVAANGQVPVEKININGKIFNIFKDLFVGQTLVIPNTWLPSQIRRIPVSELKQYGYSFDIYRFNDNPRIWTHDQHLDRFLVDTFFPGCNPTLPKCPGSEPFSQQYYDYNQRLQQLWGANLDKAVITIGKRCGQYKPMQILSLQPGDIVKIPADWPDPHEGKIMYLTKLDEVRRMLIPLNGKVTPTSKFNYRVTRGPLRGFGTFNSTYYRMQRWGSQNIPDYMKPGF